MLSSLLSISDVPKGAETFSVSGSPGVEVFTVYSTAQVTEPTGKAYWPLNAGVDVIISVDTASKALNDLEVRGYFPTEGKSPPQSTSHSHITPTQPNPTRLCHAHPGDTS